MKILGEQTPTRLDGSNTLTKSDVKDLCRTLASRQRDSDVPFYLVNLGAVNAKLTEWRRHLPRVKPFYAVKCNPDHAVLDLMLQHGTGFDVASKKEIEQCLKMGADPSELVFANPCKLSSHIKYAAAKGVQKMTFDNVNELRKVKKLHPTAQLILRISTDDSDSICQFSQKFGAARSEWLELVVTCRELNLNLIGVSFHVGSGCRDAKQYFNSIRDARQVFDLARDYGYELDVLDIGGGFPGYPNEQAAEPSFVELATEINAALDKCFTDLNINVIAEPGRYMVSSAFILVTKVTTVRDNGTGDCRYYINDGVYGSFNNILHDHAQPKPELLSTDLTSGKMAHQTCSIWGPSCDGLDQINAELYFPQLKEGDFLVWFDMGAYTGCVATEFNGFPMPRYFYVPHGANVQRLRTSSISEFNRTKCQEVGVEC